MPNDASTRRLVLTTTPLAEAPTRWLAARCDVETIPADSPRFESKLGCANALVVRTYTRVDDALLDRAPRLSVVGRAGVGLDNIDVAACRARNIEVVYTPDANTQAVVEYVVCLLGDGLRPRVRLDAPVSAEAWSQLRRETVAARQMNELTLGILGLGRVGRGVAAVASAIGFDVQYNDLLEIPKEHRSGARPVHVEALFTESDVISIHIDGRADNREFVSRTLIDRMRPEVLLINTSRGFTVDNRGLASFLTSHPRARAILDVHEPEPIVATYPLLGIANADLLPHLASRTGTAMVNMSWVVRDVWASLAGEPPRFRADLA